MSVFVSGGGADLADVKLRVGSAMRPGHRSILAARAAYFEAMFRSFSPQDNIVNILSTPVQLTKPERLSEEDIQLDSKCVELVSKYITNNSSVKSQHELALQGFREEYNQLIELSRGLKKAHGNA